MDIKEIKRLVELMITNDLSEMDICEGENKVHLKRGIAGPVVTIPAMAAPIAAPVAASSAASAPAEKFIEIRSPMVGTFYAAQSPDSEAYASVGVSVSTDSVVCIIEAMKVMNEIKAECSGEIVEICVKNAQPVEYGQVLFKVRPA